MTQLRAIWFIAMKDLRIFAGDRMALFFAILFPFLFVVLFNFLLSDVGGDDYRLVLHVVTQESEGGLSHQIIDSMVTTDDAQLEAGEPKIVWYGDYDRARQAVENKELEGFLAFPADFTDAVFTGGDVRFEVVADSEAVYTSAALHGLANAIATRVATEKVAVTARVELVTGQELTSLGEVVDTERTGQYFSSGEGDPAAGRSLIEFRTEKVGEVEPGNAANYVIPGYLVMFVFFAAAQSAPLIVRERLNHTLERLLASSVRPISLLGGIFVGTAAKGLIQIVIFWTVGILVFNIDLGRSPAAVIILSVLMVIMSAAFGILLATLVKTERSAGSTAVITALVLAPLGGCWWPLFIVPKWMQFIAKVTPHGWANTGFNKLMVFGADFGAAVPEMLALIGFAVIFGLMASWRFRTSAA